MQTFRLLLICLLFALDIAPATAQSDNITAVENGLVPLITVEGETTAANLQERMAFHHIPAVSIAVINDGEIEWAQAWGDSVTADTLFQAASISKPIAASGALMLVDDGLVELDVDVSQYLTSWQIPENSFREPVTLRRLLSHTAGINIHGFLGYPHGVEIPTLLQVLNSEGRANTPPVVVQTAPGSEYRYSGGGYLIVQQMMEDVTGQPFDEFRYSAKVCVFLGQCDTKLLTDMSELKGAVRPHLLRWVSYPDVGQRLRSSFYEALGTM